MAAPSDRWHPLARAEEVEYDRVLFFSDAIFAIAITLLVVDLQVPDGPVQSGTLLRETLPQMGGFALSFAVIGLFWIGHHGLFRHIKGLNRTLIMLNLLFLGCVAFLPTRPPWSARPGTRCRRPSSMRPASSPPGWPRRRSGCTRSTSVSWPCPASHPWCTAGCCCGSS